MGSGTIWTLELGLSGEALARTHRVPQGPGQGCTTHTRARQQEATELGKSKELMGKKRAAIPYC